MTTYEQVLGGRANLDGVNFGAANPNPGSLGQQILQACNGLNPAVHHDMQQITQIFPRFRGQTDYAANVATYALNSNSTGLKCPRCKCLRAGL
jgi:hypothetical protein